MPDLSDLDISTIPTERVAAVVIKCKYALTPLTRQWILEQWEAVMKRNPKLPPCILLDNGLEIVPIAELPGDA
jgi:hypothetical protein